MYTCTQRKIFRCCTCSLYTQGKGQLARRRWEGVGGGVALYVTALCLHRDTPGNLKQLVTEWLSKHPTFAGLNHCTWYNLYTRPYKPLPTLPTL